MHELFKNLLLRWLKVPAEPEPPSGTPESIRVFRAAPNFYKLHLALWAFRQVAALLGIVFFLFFWSKTAGRRAPEGVELLFHIIELIGLGVFFIQLPFTFMLVRLDWEMRWYIVTDRSLRIRTGILRVHEATLTFANIQQISVLQGPVQRLLGISDLQVTTAGGGSSGGAHPHREKHQSMHEGYFHGIANASEVRELILQRLRQYRDTGLGDPDEIETAEPVSPLSAGANPKADVLGAAAELLAETRRLREASGSR